MRFKGIQEVIRDDIQYKKIISSLSSNKTPCQVHGLSESQKALISCCLFEDFKGQVLLLTHNDMEAKKLYDDIRVFTDKCVYFPIRQMVFNVDVTSGDIKIQRLKAINKLLDGENIIVVASIDAIFYKMPPLNIIKKAAFNLSTGNTIEVIDFASKLYALGYERVDIVEGKGQFAQRGGIIDIFSPMEEEPYRIEFFGDEVDTIRTFDIISQRSQSKLSDVKIYPAREIILDGASVEEAVKNIKKELDIKYKSYSKKNSDMADRLKNRINENIERLQNERYFDGIDSYIGSIYNEAQNFIDYFNNPLILLDESGRIVSRIKSAYDEFEDNFKSLLDRGDLLPSQGEYMYPFSRIIDILLNNNIVSFNMLPRIVEDIKPLLTANFNAISLNNLSGNIDILLDEIRDKSKKGFKVLIFAGTAARAQRLVNALKEENFNCIYKEKVEKIEASNITITFGSLSRGMEFPDIKLYIISDREIFTDKKQTKRVFTKKGKKIQSFTDMKPGDFVVHANHGIGLFDGIKELVIDGIKKDYLVLSYRGGDTLYVPVEQLDMVQKYIGSNENPPKLYKLGGSDWAKTKKKVKDSLKEMAEDLIGLYAERSTLKGYKFSKDTVWQKQFEDEFPYTETPDQLTSIADIKLDMESNKPMDRLLCGDVGYGKTEVAMRAAFKAVMDGKQVAVLVPTTILAEQHYNNFKQRFSEFPVNIDMISRFRSSAQQKATIKEIGAGNIDIIIGTHRLLQRDIKYKDLGLLIVDEEQRFGVSHKEKIKALKKDIDVLTLSATPIPRTLHMSLIGVRDMSVIETPPEERYPVQTYVMEYNENIIRDAIVREMSRGGQVFFVYNRVETIRDMQIALSNLVPECKVSIAHGQMDEKELEEAIMGFINGEGDILLCTTIIETGIDMPNVNTLIVYDADRMGLSQLYQLRGRVGRSNRLAYSYFTYRRDKVLNEIAEKRLKAIKEFTEFGSGFKIAMRDLEIRGAGNLLSTKQHGHMAAVGYDLYCKLLAESVNEIKGDISEEEIETTIELSVNAYIPDDYIEDEVLKIEIYKKVASLESKEDKMDIEEEIVDRFGDIPKPVENLIQIAYIKSIAKKLKIVSIKQMTKQILVTFSTPDLIGVDVLRRVNESMKNIVDYGSIKEPIIRLKIGNLLNSEILKVVKDFTENIQNFN